MSESIGAALRSAREARRLTLAQVSETTRVRSHYLQALENDDVSAMPSAAQARGFLRIYARFLDLDLDALIPAPAATPAAPPAAEIPAGQPEAQPPRPGLLTQLRQRIALRGGPETEAGARGEGALSAEAPAERSLPPLDPHGKKKVVPG